MVITDTLSLSCETTTDELRPNLSIQELTPSTTPLLRSIQSDIAASEYPDKYSLIIVTKECEYGVSSGLLLHVADSIDELNRIASLYGVEDQLLHYVTGIDLF